MEMRPKKVLNSFGQDFSLDGDVESLIANIHQIGPKVSGRLPTPFCSNSAL